jgi:3D-(3,5/4)-trihydroxycyclohexane-1,2-dione acylhydrolase (decyclizing)
MDRLFKLESPPLLAQSAVIGALWEASGPRDVLVSAAGSHPGDLHKLWPTRSPNGYHMEYGYSCMGYEIPGAMGAKMADPSREVFVFVGDGTYQMMPTEIATAVQEGVKLIIVLVDNHGYASIGGLSESIGSAGFGTRYRERSKASGELDGKVLTVDYVANARSLGAIATKASTIAELKEALARAKSSDHTNVIVVETEREVRVPSYDSWWDVAVAEVSEDKKVQAARSRYEEARRKERYYL